ncbi:MAG: phage minor capsid protein [Anaerobutyricum sp.]
MLTPEYLQSVGVDIENLFYDAETDILIDIARRIRENDFKMTATAEYQVQKLKELGLATKTINDILAEALNTSNEKIEEIMQESIYKAIRSDMYIYEVAAWMYPEYRIKSKFLKAPMPQRVKSKTYETTAQLGTNKLIELIDKAYLKASSGSFSYDMDISNVINDLAANGLGMIEYPTGTRRRIDTVARTAVRTAVNQSALKCQEDVMDEMDVNLVETSSHLGARPSHAEWQGRIFWRLKPYGNYENFKEATGYGTGAGLGGWNCRHSFYPYFPGLSERTYQHYRKKENEEVYQLEQEQRYNERKIREWKRRQAVNKAGGVDTTLECRKVREWQQRQADFLKAHPDMKRNYSREMVEKRVVRKKV